MLRIQVELTNCCRAVPHRPAQTWAPSSQRLIVISLCLTLMITIYPNYNFIHYIECVCVTVPISYCSIAEARKAVVVQVLPSTDRCHSFLIWCANLSQTLNFYYHSLHNGLSISIMVTCILHRWLGVRLFLFG